MSLLSRAFHDEALDALGIHEHAAAVTLGCLLNEGVAVTELGVAAVTADLHALMAPRGEGALDDDLIATCGALVSLTQLRDGDLDARSAYRAGRVRRLLEDFVGRYGDDVLDPTLGKKGMTEGNKILVVGSMIRLRSGIPQGSEDRKKFAIRGMNVGISIFRTDRADKGINGYTCLFAERLIAYVEGAATTGTHSVHPPSTAAPPSVTESSQDSSLASDAPETNAGRPEPSTDGPPAKRRYRRFRGNEPQARPHSEPRITALENLEAVVTRRCRREWEIIRLAERYPMPVRWALIQSEITDSADNVFGPDEEPTFDVRSDDPDDLAEQFLDLDRQRLVVLGDAGAGKSVLAHILQSQLLTMRSWVIPVLLPVTRWDVDKFPHLRDWLVYRLTRDFPEVWEPGNRGTPMVEQIIDGDHVLPLLDGLDEVAPQSLPKIWNALKNYSGHGALVLTCRTDTYSRVVAKRDVLKSAAVIEGQRLSPADAVAYLEQSMTPRQIPRWLAVFAVLQSRADTPLSEVCAHPLGLWLIRTIYIDNEDEDLDKGNLADPSEMLDGSMYPTALDLKNYLFASLIPTVVRRRTHQPDGRDPLRPRQSWNSTAAQKWLTYIASQLSESTDIRWWQLPYRARALGRLTSKLEEPGNATALSRNPLPFVVRRYSTYSMLVDLAVGLTMGPFFVGLAHVSSSGIFKFIAERLPGSIAQSLVIAAIVGGVVGVIVGLALPCFSGLKDWLLLSHDHGSDVVDECPACVADERNRMRWRTPLSSYRDSLNRAIVGGIGGALGLFVLYEIVCLIWRSSRATLAQLMAGTQMTSMFDGLTAAGLGPVIVGTMYLAIIVAVVVEPAWFVFIISSKWLALRGKLPWHIMPFLDDAHRLGLLRASGAVYQFRHAELRDYLEGGANR